MSRVFITGLPKNVSETRLRNHFAEIGEITDCAILWAKSPQQSPSAPSAAPRDRGAKPRMAFVGFRDVAAAEAAVSAFNQTFLDTRRLTVEIALPFQRADLSRCRSRATQLKVAKLRAEGEANANASCPPSKASKEEPDSKDLPSKSVGTSFQDFLHVVRHSKLGSWQNDLALPPAPEPVVPDQSEQQARAFTCQGSG